MAISCKGQRAGSRSRQARLRLALTLYISLFRDVLTCIHGLTRTHLRHVLTVRRALSVVSVRPYNRRDAQRAAVDGFALTCYLSLFNRILNLDTGPHVRTVLTVIRALSLVLGTAVQQARRAESRSRRARPHILPVCVLFYILPVSPWSSTHLYTRVDTYDGWGPGYALVLPPFNREEPLYESFSRGGGQFL